MLELEAAEDNKLAENEEKSGPTPAEKTASIEAALNDETSDIAKLLDQVFQSPEDKDRATAEIEKGKHCYIKFGDRCNALNESTPFQVEVSRAALVRAMMM